MARAQHHTNLDAPPRLTEPVGGGRRFVEDPPLLTHVEECGEDWVEEVPARYRTSLSEERRRLLSRFRPHDAARKVVGVGSVGTRCYVVLLLVDRADDPLLLQIKQATTAVLEPYAGRSRHRHHGRRVVSGQRLLQTASDIFLGWSGPTPAAATPPPSAATSEPGTVSTWPWPTSPRPTPTRPRPTTPPSSGRARG